MKTKLLVVLALVAAVIVAAVLLGDRPGEDARDGQTPDRGRERRHVEVTWPPELDAADRDLMTPIVDGLAGDDGAVGKALTDLAAADLRTRLGSRARPVLVLVNPFLDEILRVSSDRLRRSALLTLRAWVTTVDGAAREALSDAIPLDAIAAAFGASGSDVFRREAIVLLADVPGPAALRLIVRALPHDDPTVRRETLRALATREDPCARDVLRRRLEEDDDPGVKAEILRLWGRVETLRPPDVAERVRPLLESPETAVRVSAIELVGFLADRESLGSLEKALARGGRDTRLAVVIALGRMGGTEPGRLLATVEDPGEEDPEISRSIRWARGRCE